MVAQVVVLLSYVGTRPRALMAWEGRSNGSIITDLNPMWSENQLLDNHVVVGDPKGGSGGTAVDMLSVVADTLTTKLKSITVWSGSGVDAIECQFQLDDGTVISSGKKGGNGGGAHNFELRAGEQITRVQGHSNTGISQFQFFTNQGRFSDVYGGNSGEPFVWLPPTYNPNAEVTGLIYFEGAPGKFLDRLTPVWASAPPAGYQLIIDSFDLSQLEQTGKVEAAWSNESIIDNESPNHITSTFEWSMEAEKTSTLTFSQTTKSLIGNKVATQVAVRATAGIPYVGELQSEATIGVEVSQENEWGTQATDSTTISRSYYYDRKAEVTIDPMAQGQGKAVGYRMECADLRWTGKVIITYSDGTTKTVPADGTLSSSSMTKMHTTYTQMPL
ncbi:hypothetical protein E1B28_009009 [Marasmius oreades]|uniref:Jacalin-type lectin domain-containing protein n=1 Tax=Marasmius oreades TaxID=181124 RepID=A0A9P7USY4_9AGAR|nr:uncharacterized protein E1B28_009009 [Marasmius oreades]KAG7092675.1 hypothetical protein E1B28_009009 [Marasmius oreades]